MVEAETATAVGLYNVIKTSFEEKKIPIKNIIGFSSDTTNVMFGEHQSVVETKEFVETKAHKLLRIGQTRWLSLESCVKRVLEQWEVLCLYFSSVVNEKKGPSCTSDIPVAF